MKKSSTKTAKRSSVKLPIKMGRLNVYLLQDETKLALGANGTPKTPSDFALDIPRGAPRRKFRKALHAVDPHLAALSVPSKRVERDLGSKVVIVDGVGC